MESFSVEKKRLMAQPRIEKSVELVQANLIIEEKEVVKELDQDVINQEDEVLKSHVLEAEASPEKEAEVSRPDVSRFVGEPSKNKESEKSSSSEGKQAKNVVSSKPLPFPSITATNIHDNILNPYYDLGKLSDIVNKVCEEVMEEEEEKYESELEKDGPELSIHVHTHISPIQTAPTDSQEISSNEGSSAVDDSEIKQGEFADLHMTQNEMEQTLKKNTYEVHIVNKSYSKFEKNFFKQQSKLFDCERENNIEMHNEVMDAMSLLRYQLEEENAKAATEKEKNLITQGEDNSGRRGSSVSTGTRSKRKPIGDDSDRPNKRGRGRISDRGGRSTGSDRGGRSTGGDRGGRNGGTGRGGRSLPPFRNLLTGEEMSGEGLNYPIDPLIKREEQ
ncbi:keratin, type I cytoskeletal 9-like [Impatiens glandulifera]|uniref:keratin, type I cytoskeletal 9-like n=1 Tax=Impatiens glandulifera TaxID=253017 RepID=UPI001FB12832|nr:keratin, type I cytoskeletal 9-like [Impatiens glandulifera]